MDMDDVCTLLHCLRNREGFTDAQMNDLRKAFQRNKSDETDRTGLVFLERCRGNVKSPMILDILVPTPQNRLVEEPGS